ncbi:MAG: hypothetical protein KF844_08865 [Cryobacterium sp.]|nr:hypothetical protein [Cryobacterium sp.]
MVGRKSESRNRDAVERIRDRHGRGIRSSVTGRVLPRLRSRITDFESTISVTIDYLVGLWPNELSGLRVEVADLPKPRSTNERLHRWLVVAPERRVLFYRLPIERLSRLHRNDEFHRKMMVEGIVFQAIAELLEKDPWDLAPDRFRFH